MPKLRCQTMFGMLPAGFEPALEGFLDASGGISKALYP